MYFLISLLCLLGIIAYFIMPRFRFQQKIKPFLNADYAHRGLHGSAGPENSLAAFRAAQAGGFGSELDIQALKDGTIVVHHDFDLSRSCGVEKRLCTVSWSDVEKLRLFSSEEGIPSFDQVLNLTDGQVPLIIEIKAEERAVEAFCQRVAERLDCYDGSFLLESFNPFVLSWFKKKRPQWLRGQLAGGTGHLFVDQLFCLFLSRPDFIAYHVNSKKPWVLRLLLLFKFAAVAWTVRSVTEARAGRTWARSLIFEVGSGPMRPYRRKDDPLS